MHHLSIKRTRKEFVREDKDKERTSSSSSRVRERERERERETEDQSRLYKKESRNDETKISDESR